MLSNFAVCLARTRKFSGDVLIYYTRLLGWALDAQSFPVPSLLGNMFPRLRQPKLPEHTVAVRANGEARCVRCLLPAALPPGRQCREAGMRAHALGAGGRGTFCRTCGAYAFTHVVLLAGQCPGRPKDATARGGCTAWRPNVTQRLGWRSASLGSLSLPSSSGRTIRGFASAVGFPVLFLFWVLRLFGCEHRSQSMVVRSRFTHCFVCLFVCLFVHLFHCLFVCLCLCPCVPLFVSLQWLQWVTTCCQQAVILRLI